MLESVASSEFLKYGKIEPLGMEFAMVNNALSSIRQREVYKQRMTHLFFSRRTNTIIDVIYGSAVLAVGTSLEELHLFLLDTTVMIHKNVYFYVLPLLSKAVISMSGWGSDYETVPLPSSQSYLTLHPPLYIRDFFSAGLLERPEGSATAPEKGRSFTLFYLLEGGGTMQIDEKKSPPLPGRCSFAASGAVFFLFQRLSQPLRPGALRYGLWGNGAVFLL